MKTICPISGIPIWKSDLLLGFDLEEKHPIFNAKSSLILNKTTVHRFAFSENVLEKRLLYLAVLSNTFLVEFNHPAAPELVTMEKTFYRLMPLAQWVSFAAFKFARIVAFPQYIVRQENHKLENIDAWISAIEVIQEKLHKRELDRDRNAELLQKNNEIKKELNEAIAIGRAFTPRLAKWSLDICDIRPTHPQYAKWMKILCTPVKEVWIYTMEDLVEIRDILQERLPNLEMNPQAISVMFQMKELIAECKRGFTEFTLFNDDPESADFEIVDETMDHTGTMQQSTHKINQHLIDAPTVEPQLRDFATKLDYLVAKAKWQANQKVQSNVISEDSV